MKKIKVSKEITAAELDGKSVPVNLVEFKDKQFARYFLMTKGDLKKSFEMTFGKAGTIEEMDTMLRRDLVKNEIERLLPTDKQIAAELSRALGAKTPDSIKWSEKHQFIDTILKLKGYTKNEEGNKTQVNIGMVIEK